MNSRVVEPDWPAPPGVRAFSTLRAGGASRGPWGRADTGEGGWNLGAACGDDPVAVARNRALLRALLPAEPCWLEQVHGADVVRVRAPVQDGHWIAPRADAAVTGAPGVVLAILTADCIPVLFADARGTAVGAAHAGWRGLAGGVLERTAGELAALAGPGSEILAWLGPAIGPTRFEVGADVLEAFVAGDAGASAAFAPAGADGKYLCDLFALARRRLARCGVHRVHGGVHCTASDPARFYSHRRDRSTGRMASLIWLDGQCASP